MVQSKRDAAVWYHVNGDCPCAASEHRQEVCYHRLAARLYARVAARLEADEERYELTAQVPADTPTIPAEAIVLIQGRQFIRFEGLLHLAHERGLVELSTTIVSVASDLAVCQSTARFPDGRVFTDIGDASPSNVKHHLAPHFIRMAATRASARALRRALNIDACSVEELGD